MRTNRHDFAGVLLMVLGAVLSVGTATEALALECSAGYPVVVTGVIDGDTARVHIDMGLDIYHADTVRLAGIDAPELHGATKAAGAAARDFLVAWAKSCPRDLTLFVLGREKYGRILGRLQCGHEDASAALLGAGHARPYNGGAR